MTQPLNKAAVCVAVLIVLTVIAATLSRNPVSAQGSPGTAPVTIVSPLPLPVTGTVTVGNLGTATLPVNVTNFSGYYVTQ